MVMQSDRIILDSQDEDVTVSSNRHINIGAGKNMSVTNKGYTVLESKNIYIGNKAKELAQPMVFGTELQKTLKEVLNFVASLKFLNPVGAPTPVFVNAPGDLGVPGGPLKVLMDKLGLSEEFKPANDPESLEPENPIATFLSSKHFIEPNG